MPAAISSFLAAMSDQHVERGGRVSERAVAQDDLRVAPQRLRVGPERARERVAGARDGDDAHAREAAGLHRVLVEAERGRDGEVGRFVAQRLDRAREALGAEVQPHLREALAHGVERGRERPERRHRVHREAQGRLRLAGERAREAAQRLRALDHDGRALEEAAARLGERGAVRAAVEQLDAELLLEVAHQLAHRRLRLVEARRGRREGALGGDTEEGAELVVGHRDPKIIDSSYEDRDFLPFSSPDHDA
jgi:hypothetical protein